MKATKPSNVTPKRQLSTIPDPAKRFHVEKLISYTIIEPLQKDWEKISQESCDATSNGRVETDFEPHLKFLRDLSQLTILDPACDTGDVLCTALVLLKDFEKEVRSTLGRNADATTLDAIHQIDSVGPHQFLGIDSDPHKATEARLRIQFTYLQWQMQNAVSIPFLQSIPDSAPQIETRDALLSSENREPLLNRKGQPVFRWDGTTLKHHPTTGQMVPDHNFRVPDFHYTHPAKSPWPVADFIVSHLPNQTKNVITRRYGDSYVTALRSAYPKVPESAVYCMYWWEQAAEMIRQNRESNPALRSFGFLTSTNIRQTHNRPVLERHLRSEEISLLYASPNLPTVDGGEQIKAPLALTVAAAGKLPGQLITFDPIKSNTGFINADLTIGPDISRAMPLESNTNMAYQGITLSGNGFLMTPREAVKLGLGQTPGLEKIIRPFRTSSDLMQDSRDLKVIDLFGYTETEVRKQHPQIYDWLLKNVKPERDASNNKTLKQNWWLPGKDQPAMRAALKPLPRYIATPATAKYRVFVFIDGNTLADEKLITIASDDAYHLGILSSRIHKTWALAMNHKYDTKSTPEYDNKKCYETFPFPSPSTSQRETIRSLGEQLNCHRKQQQTEHPRLTLSMIYNVMKKVKADKPLTTKDQTICNDGKINDLIDIQSKLDVATTDAYGWANDISNNSILAQLILLNKQPTNLSS